MEFLKGSLRTEDVRGGDREHVARAIDPLSIDEGHRPT
jgi:hypothetical protein